MLRGSTFYGFAFRTKRDAMLPLANWKNFTRHFGHLLALLSGRQNGYQASDPIG